MRVLCALVSVFIIISAASAAELKVKVVDPQSAAVAGAQVLLARAGESTVIATQTSNAEGICTFRPPAAGNYEFKVLAPGFAPETHAVNLQQAELTVRLRLAAASETVVVSATRTPVPAQDAGVSVSTLEARQLEVMQPIASDDALRFLPGAIVNAAGQRGGLTSLFVRGGDSRYNKVLIDDVPVNEPGGTFDFGVLPLAETGRLEFARGAQSTLYGSDAMTSVVQIFSRTGSTPIPEFRFGADGGNLGTEHGYASISGAHEILDYNLWGDHFNSTGSGINDDYSNSLQGGNVGVQLGAQAQFRLRARHSNSRTGVQGEWDFNGQKLFPPDMEQRARNNNLLASAELTLSGPSGWQHRFTGFEDNLRRFNEDDIAEPARAAAFDFPFRSIDRTNRAGFEYQGDYSERTWAHTTFGYQFEDETGFVGDPALPAHGLRLNHAAYGQQVLQLRRLSVVAGARFVHNQTFGNKTVPRVALTLQALRGGEIFSGTRLRFSYATGIKEPRFDESFPSAFVNANFNLKAEENRAFETGAEQNLFGGKYSFSAIYFNNLFHNQIDFNCCDNSGKGQFVNVNKSIAHGAEVGVSGRVSERVRLDMGYTYTSTQILAAPFCTAANFCDSRLMVGQPLIRRPKHSATVLLSYLGGRWGGNLGGRADSDFLGLSPPIDHAAGYVRVDIGGWYAIHRRVTAYLNIENALDRRYNEVVGYPALPINFRAGLRFRAGGE